MSINSQSLLFVRTFYVDGFCYFSPAMFIAGLVTPLTKVHDKWEAFWELNRRPLIYEDIYMVKLTDAG